MTINKHLSITSIENLSRLSKFLGAKEDYSDRKTLIRAIKRKNAENDLRKFLKAV